MIETSIRILNREYCPLLRYGTPFPPKVTSHICDGILIFIEDIVKKVDFVIDLEIDFEIDTGYRTKSITKSFTKSITKSIYKLITTSISKWIFDIIHFSPFGRKLLQIYNHFHGKVESMVCPSLDPRPPSFWGRG